MRELEFETAVNEVRKISWMFPVALVDEKCEWWNRRQLNMIFSWNMPEDDVLGVEMDQKTAINAVIWLRTIQDFVQDMTNTDVRRLPLKIDGLKIITGWWCGDDLVGFIQEVTSRIPIL